MKVDRETLIRYLEGDMPGAEAAALRARLAQDAALRAQLDRLAALRETLQAEKPDAFAPYFSERVVRRLAPAAQAGSAESLYESLRWVFARTAVAGLLLAGALGAYNVVDYQSLGVASSVAEALFGIPSASLMDALAYGL